MLDRYLGFFTVREWIAVIVCHVIVYFGFAGFVLLAAWWQGWRPA